MIDVREITDMQNETVARWHEQEIDNPYSGFLETACKQHSYNFLIWHEEDVARATDVPIRESPKSNGTSTATTRREMTGLNSSMTPLRS